MLKVAFFSAQAYDNAIFSSLRLEQKSVDETPSSTIDFTFFPHPLNTQTAITCKGFDAVCVFVNDDLSAPTLATLANLKVKHVALRCAGFNNVDVHAAKALGIKVSRVPAYSPQTVAEHTLALILTLNRKTHKAYNRVREGNFALEGLMGFTLFNKTVGIIGTGKIGQAVIRILNGFGCKILCCDPNPHREVEKLGATYTSLENVMSQCQIVSLHCPLNDDSYHLINEATLALMPKGAMLINTSRGGLIDDTAVIGALKKQHLGYLGLDVYERESELFFSDHSLDIIQDDIFQRLLTFPNVLVTGHQGFFTQEALAEIAQVTVSNLLLFTHDSDVTANDNLVDV